MMPPAGVAMRDRISPWLSWWSEDDAGQKRLALPVLLQTRRIKIARQLLDAQVLETEMDNFRV
jgi:hypothetical protein